MRERDEYGTNGRCPPPEIPTMSKNSTKRDALVDMMEREGGDLCCRSILVLRRECTHFSTLKLINF